MAKRTTKVLQSLSAKGFWTTMKTNDKGHHPTYKAIKAAGRPVRVLHPNGNFKVIANAAALPPERAITSSRLVASK